MSDQVELFKNFTYGMIDYLQRHSSNAELIETYLNLILGQLTGQSGSLSVPLGLQEIFDRRGLIGADSYDFSEGALSGPDYNFSVAPGAYWHAGTFYRKTAAATLSMAGKPAGTYYLNLDGGGAPLVSTAPDGTTTRQFTWTESTHTISAKAIYTGVAILFDGADYADCLDSAARGKAFTRLATRLEEIEVLLARTVQTPASGDNIAINWALGGHVRVLLDRATTTFAFSGAYDGQKCILELIQDTTGGRAAAFGAETVAGTDLTFPAPLTPDANKKDFLGFIFTSNSGKYNYVSISRGF